MSSLDALTGTGTYAKEIGGTAAAPSVLVEATVATTATARDEEVMVLIGAEGSQLQAGPCRWQPHGASFPARGDACVIGVGDQGHRVIVWWKSSRPDLLPWLVLDAADGPNIDKALTAAIAALGSAGGKILVPAGMFEIASPPSLDGTRNIQIIGAGGVTAGARSATTITYTGSAARAVDARSTYGFKLRDLMLLYDNPSFTGTLLDLTHGSSGADAAYSTIDNVYLGGSGVRTAGRLVDLDRAITATFQDCAFQNAVIAARGKAGSGSYSNAISFNNCTFISQTTAHVRNAGQGWAFNSCTFENLVDPVTGANAGAGAYISDFAADGVAFRDCWMGDAGTTGAWISYIGNGLVLDGGYIGGGQVGMRLDNGDGIGVVVNGTVFDQNEYGIIVNTGGGDSHDGLNFDTAVFKTQAAAKRISWGNHGSAPPSAGSHGVGEVRFNRVPAAGGYVGWTCVAAGTPGTWKAFGAIAP